MSTVSIIIPTYNRSAFLKETLESISNQTYTDYEVFVIDDGSPNDEAKEVCELFEKVNYFKIENSGGPAKPRNIGIEKAKGKYFAFVDDDDIWLPQKLEIQVAILDNNSTFGLVHCCCEVVDENGELKNIIVGRPGTPDVKHGDVSLRMMGNWTIMMPTPILRKEVVDIVGFFNEEIPAGLEDVEFWTRCSFFTSFYYIDEALALYRVHSGNISGNSAKYIELPLYLKKVLSGVYDKGKISKEECQLLIYQLCRMQLKMIKKYRIKSLFNLLKLNPFWMFRFGNLKLFIFLLLKR